ncbi:hypothetical protein GCM10009854_07480 [Saccharopolyspora halophila]|uniref:Uncharacterized protein n=1 Tax=Saccharopolyspora halophila TaxID=405551 RepID=A0ABN3FNX4_9PSEU
MSARRAIAVNVIRPCSASNAVSTLSARPVTERPGSRLFPATATSDTNPQPDNKAQPQHKEPASPTLEAGRPPATPL